MCPWDGLRVLAGRQNIKSAFQKISFVNVYEIITWYNLSITYLESTVPPRASNYTWWLVGLPGLFGISFINSIG